MAQSGQSFKRQCGLGACGTILQQNWHTAAGETGAGTATKTVACKTHIDAAAKTAPARANTTRTTAATKETNADAQIK